MTSAIISLGGNIYAIGTSDGRPFRIGVQDPAGEGGAILGYVEVTNKSVVTSGDYQRFFVQDGKVYHHILDPETGYPTDNGLASVTIISDRSTDGDALSTSCFVLGLEDGMELVNGIDGVEAIFVDHDGNMYFSDGLEPVWNLFRHDNMGFPKSGKPFFICISRFHWFPVGM